MDECHRAQRVVDSVASVGERVLYRKNEAGGQLPERTSRVHEGRRVRLEAAIDHQAVEVFRHARDLAVARSIATVSFSDRSRDAPEHVFRLLHRRARAVLDQISLSDHGPRVVIQLRFALGRDGRYGHYTTLRSIEGVSSKKTTDSELHAWASMISMRAGILPVFVSPRQC